MLLGIGGHVGKVAGTEGHVVDEACEGAALTDSEHHEALAVVANGLTVAMGQSTNFVASNGNFASGVAVVAHGNIGHPSLGHGGVGSHRFHVNFRAIGQTDLHVTNGVCTALGGHAHLTIGSVDGYGVETIFGYNYVARATIVAEEVTIGTHAILFVPIANVANEFEVHVGGQLVGENHCSVGLNHG